MVLLRSLIYFLSLILSVVVFATPMSIFGWFLPFSVVGRIANMWGMTNLWLLKVICGLSYDVKGWENVPKKNGIFLSKHQSAWETIALRGLLPPEQTWVLKRELMWIPLFGWALAVAQSIGIDRKAGRKAIRQVIEEGTKRLRQNRWVVIFPEGTRVDPGERKKYGAGGAMLAERSGYPVIPIAHNAGVFWRRRGLRKYPGVIQVVIGPVIETEGLKAAEINQRVEEWIETTMLQLPQSLPEQQ